MLFNITQKASVFNPQNSSHQKITHGNRKVHIPLMCHQICTVSFSLPKDVVVVREGSQTLSVLRFPLRKQNTIRGVGLLVHSFFDQGQHFRLHLDTGHVVLCRVMVSDVLPKIEFLQKCRNSGVYQHPG